MQSRTEDFWAELRIENAKEHYLRSFELYEEYSQRAIVDTVRLRRKIFEESDICRKKELQAEVEREVENFRTWLEENKNLEQSSAHYYSVSLKSLLLGLSMGVEVAQLFGAILSTQARK